MRKDNLRLRLHRGPLSYRAALRRTFGGMSACLALLLMSLGGYLIENQLADPVGSHPAGLFAAAIFISAGLILLSYLVHPGPRRKSRPVAYEILELPVAEEVPVVKAAVAAPTTGVEANDPPRELSPARRYVDQARVRL